jgi:flavin reductase (DIM6/NTAB) family NADH-FMN oxidoreductase RutF
MADFYRLVARPTVVVTTVSKRGVPNAAPFSFNSPMASRPRPLYGFCCETSHDTWKNIQLNSEFVVNLVGADFGPLMKAMERDYPYEVSEITECGLTEERSVAVKPPRIGEAYGWIECKMREHVELSERSVWIIGEVLQAEAKEGFFDGVLNVERANPLFHLWDDKFLTEAKMAIFPRNGD